MNLIDFFKIETYASKFGVVGGSNGGPLRRCPIAHDIDDSRLIGKNAAQRIVKDCGVFNCVKRSLRDQGRSIHLGNKC